VRQNKDGEQKLFNLFGLFSILTFFAYNNLYALNFENFKRAQIQSFHKFLNKNDALFNKYLKEEWKEYKAYAPTKMYKEPKAKSIFVFKEKDILSVGPMINIPIKKEKIIKVGITPKTKVVHKDINFDYFGNQLGFNIPLRIKTVHFYPQNQEGISNFFKIITTSDYEDLLLDIKNNSRIMKLNDWGLYLLITKISKQLFPDIDRQRLLSWFLFNKLGYAVKLGMSHSHIYLMFYSKKIIYATPNYNFAGKKYYVLSNYAKGSIGNIYSYKHNYPKANRAFNLSLSKLPNFNIKNKTKNLKFNDYGKDYKLSFDYNQNLIDFLATYPQADYRTYFDAPIQNRTYEDIAKGLKNYINGERASVAINFLLHFVQKAFGYERDKEQFGREKVMFAEETLYYNKSDCEDRAVLFSYLVRKLLKIGVIGVKYNDHMSTALYIPMRGYSLKDNGKRYVIADPTYINANVGQIMPKYKSIHPDSFIKINN